MSILDPIHNYCERSGTGLWDEPLNALSNAAFFIAAWMLYRIYRQKDGDKISAILIFLVALVGTGSTLFHTFANQLTMIGDVVPIALFTFYYLWVALRRLMGLKRNASFISLVAFTAVAAAMSHVPDEYKFNGSVAYFPCFLALLLIGIILRRRKHPAASYLLGAAAWFAVSLTCRSVDFILCPLIPIGTHFLWHSINGLVLYLLVVAIIHSKNAIFKN